MENLRFSIIEEDLKWFDENEESTLDINDKGSISSECSSDAIINTEFHQFFQRQSKSHIIWNSKEIEDTLKQNSNAMRIFKMMSYLNFFDLEKLSDEANTALLLSTWYESIENVQILLDNSLADPNSQDIKGRTSLHFACCNGNAQIAKILLDKGANPNAWDKYMTATPLHCAASAGSVDCILLLLKRKAQINVGIEKRSPLHFAIDKNSIECVEILLKYGAAPNTPQVFTETPLHTASALGHLECIKLLLNHGADVRSCFGKRKLTALHLAAEDNYVDCVNILLENGAEVDALSVDNQTPLHLSCLSQCVETVEILLKYKANVNAIYRDGKTAIHAALVQQSRCIECIDILIKAGAAVNQSDDYGYTPLHIAALNEFSACVYTLIQYGADITSRTNGGITALSFIVRRTPDVIPKFIEKLDLSVKVNDHEIGDVDCKIQLDFQLLVPSMERGESELLLAFIEVGHKRILTHPLCETFLFLKWRRIRKFFIWSILYHAIYVLLFTLYVMGVYVRNCEDKNPCRAGSYSWIIGYFVVALNTALLGREFFEMAHGIYIYTRIWENWLQWTIILGVFLCVTPGTISGNDLYQVPKWQNHVAAVVIFFVWLELMMLVGRFPIFGLYVQMFTKVAVNFGKFLLAYCCLLIAFGFSFCVLFKNYKSFKMPWSFLKIIAMMSGELEFEDIFYGEDKMDDPILFPVTSHILFLSFVILVTVILTNLLVGLAVSDIQGLQVSAGLNRLIRQAELVARLEGLFFSKLLRKAPPRLLALCQRSALLRTTQYKLQFITRPNDARDKQLPEDIKMNIYKLVADRRDRNRILRREKCENNLHYFNHSIFDRRYEKLIDDDIDTNLLRPQSVAFGRNRLFSENAQNMKLPKNIKSCSCQNDTFALQQNIKNLEIKLDQFSDKLLRQLHTTTEELSRIKMYLDQPSTKL